MSMCVYMCVPMEEHEAWRMRHSCKLPRGRPAVLKSLVSKFFFFFGLDSKGSSVSIHSGL